MQDNRATSMKTSMKNKRVAENHGNEVVPLSNLLLVHFFFQFHTTSAVSKKLDVSVHQLLIGSYQNKTKRSLEYNLERD